MSLTASQINRLGERLRTNVPTEEDLLLLSEFRLSFAAAYHEVMEILTGRLGLSATGRPQKSTESIIAKLRRESTRLSKMQDIAGCRLVVANRVEQDMIVFEMVDYLPGTLVHDRREAPRHGYRAVHVLSTFENHPVEVQVRTILQHTWAEASERLSDVIDPAIKYGGGPSPHRDFLQNMATNIALWEEGEVALWELAAEQGRLMPASELPMKEHRERVHAILLQALRDYSNIDTVDEQ